MAEKLYYTMGELAEMFDVNTSLIRYWETQFGVLRPKRNKKGNRMFTTADVERLKLIYHLVRERGMTLEGAKKILRQQRGETQGVDREVELMERLQHIRSLLLEVREDLKDGGGEVVEIKIDSLNDSPSHQSDMPVKVRQRAQPTPKVNRATQVAQEAMSEVSVVAQPTVLEVLSSSEGVENEYIRQLLDKQDGELDVETASHSEQVSVDSQSVLESSSKDGSDVDSQTISTTPPNKPAVARRPRRRKEDAENKELFAFYEQSLF